MRTFALLLATALSPSLITGCERSPVAPTRVLPRAAQMQGAAVTVDRDVNLDGLLPPACNGDVLSGTATVHTVVRERIDGAGGLHIAFRTIWSQVKLTGTPSGASYAGSGESATEFYLAGSEVSGTYTFFVNIDLVGHGQTPNLVLRGFTHVTLTPDGSEPSFKDTFEVVCPGDQ